MTGQAARGRGGGGGGGEAATRRSNRAGGGGQSVLWYVGFSDREHTVYDLYDSISHTPTSVSGLVRVYRPVPLPCLCSVRVSYDGGHPQPLSCHGMKYIDAMLTALVWGGDGNVERREMDVKGGKVPDPKPRNGGDAGRPIHPSSRTSRSYPALCGCEDCRNEPGPAARRGEMIKYVPGNMHTPPRLVASPPRTPKLSRYCMAARAAGIAVQEISPACVPHLAPPPPDLGHPLAWHG